MTIEQLLIKYYGEKATYAFGKLYMIGTRRVHYLGGDIYSVGKDRIEIEDDKLVKVGDEEVNYSFNNKIRIGNILFKGPRKTYVEAY